MITSVQSQKPIRDKTTHPTPKKKTSDKQKKAIEGIAKQTIGIPLPEKVAPIKNPALIAQTMKEAARRIEALEEASIKTELKHAEKTLEVHQKSFETAKKLSDLKGKLEISEKLIEDRDKLIETIEKEKADAEEESAALRQEKDKLDDELVLKDDHIEDRELRITQYEDRVEALEQKLLAKRRALEDQKKLLKEYKVLTQLESALAYSYGGNAIQAISGAPLAIIFPPLGIPLMAGMAVLALLDPALEEKRLKIKAQKDLITQKEKELALADNL